MRTLTVFFIIILVFNKESVIAKETTLPELSESDKNEIKQLLQNYMFFVFSNYSPEKEKNRLYVDEELFIGDRAGESKIYTFILEKPDVMMKGFESAFNGTGLKVIFDYYAIGYIDDDDNYHAKKEIVKEERIGIMKQNGLWKVGMPPRNYIFTKELSLQQAKNQKDGGKLYKQLVNAFKK